MTIDNSSDSNRTKKSSLLSIKGLFLGLLATIALLFVQEIINYKTGSRFLHEYFILGWVFIPCLSARVYSKFSTCNENLGSILIIAILTYLIVPIFYYFADILYLSTSTKIPYAEAIAAMSFIKYITIVFYKSIYSVGKLEITRELLIVYNLIGLIFFILVTRKEVYKQNYIKTYNPVQDIKNIANEMQEKNSNDNIFRG